MWEVVAGVSKAVVPMVGLTVGQMLRQKESMPPEPAEEQTQHARHSGKDNNTRVHTFRQMVRGKVTVTGTDRATRGGTATASATETDKENPRKP